MVRDICRAAARVSMHPALNRAAARVSMQPAPVGHMHVREADTGRD